MTTTRYSVKVHPDFLDTSNIVLFQRVQNQLLNSLSIFTVKWNIFYSLHYRYLTNIIPFEKCQRTQIHYYSVWNDEVTMKISSINYWLVYFHIECIIWVNRYVHLWIEVILCTLRVSDSFLLTWISQIAMECFFWRHPFRVHEFVYHLKFKDETLLIQEHC